MTAYPRAIVTLNGLDVSGRLDHLRLTSTPWRAADTLTLRLDAHDSGDELDELLDERELEVAVWLGYVARPDRLPTKAELTKVFLGPADEDTWSYSRRGRALEVHARDYTAKLLDREVRENLGRRPASAHVTGLVTAAGLDPARVTATSAPVLLVPDGESAWDLIEDLALREGFIAYVEPGTRRFVFAPPDGGDAAEPPLLAWRPADETAALASLTCARRQQERRGVDVRVVGWDPAKRRRVEYVAKDGREGVESLGERTFVYQEVSSRSEARRRAERLLASLAAGEREVTAELQTGDAELLGGGRVRLSGAGAWDGLWHVARASHTLSRSGLTTSLTLRPPEMAAEV